MLKKIPIKIVSLFAGTNGPQSIDGVLKHRDGNEAYIKDLKRQKFKYKIKKVFKDHNDVCLLNDIGNVGKSAMLSGIKLNTVK